MANQRYNKLLRQLWDATIDNMTYTTRQQILRSGIRNEIVDEL